MTLETTDKTSPHRGVNLPALVMARICTSAIFMTYPACLNTLLTQWQMSAAQAGLVQASFTVGFAVSLLIASTLCDRIGAKRVFNIAMAFSAVAALLFALFARSFDSAMVFICLVGLSQGGTYTPAIMLVAANADPARKASGVGWVLAGMSAGYVISIFLSVAMIDRFGYEAAFLATAAFTIAGWGFGIFAVRAARDRDETGAGAAATLAAPAPRRQATLLMLGYIGHSWELLGAWAWVPAFLAAAILGRGTMSPIELGLWTALALHLTGFFSSFLSGYAADRYGARRVLIGFALVGTLCSFAIGWLDGASMVLLIAVTAVYGFVAIGDSAVLSSAMTDAVPADRLGRVLGLRSILGMSAGAAAPAVFGLTLDLLPANMAWGYAFWTLGAGGLIAFVCALGLKR
ncbi:MAG: MFS transporter [Rhodospirillaceae bacterium]|nr:MFS transporter [Rhodospirillaceae bacterium]